MCELTILRSSARHLNDGDAGGVAGSFGTRLDQGIVHVFAQGALHALEVEDAAPYQVVRDAGHRLGHLGEAGKLGGLVGGGLAQQLVDQELGQMLFGCIDESLKAHFIIAAVAVGQCCDLRECARTGNPTNAGRDGPHCEEQRKDRSGEVHLEVVVLCLFC